GCGFSHSRCARAKSSPDTSRRDLPRDTTGPLAHIHAHARASPLTFTAYTGNCHPSLLFRQSLDNVIERSVERGSLGSAECLLNTPLHAPPRRAGVLERSSTLGSQMEVARAPIAAIGLHPHQALTFEWPQAPRQGRRIHDQFLGERADADAVVSPQ